VDDIGAGRAFCDALDIIVGKLRFQRFEKIYFRAFAQFLIGLLVEVALQVVDLGNKLLRFFEGLRPLLPQDVVAIFLQGAALGVYPRPGG
jgi:hypothetical protein